MRIYGIEKILAEHPVFKAFDKETLQLLTGCARNEHFRKGDRIFTEGDPADKVFLLRQGDVAVEIATSERSPIIVETLHPGDVLGWAWMVPPYRHMSDARALCEVRAVSLGATCTRAKCDENPVLGYQMFQHLLPHMAARVRVQRLQLLDMYGPKEG